MLQIEALKNERVLCNDKLGKLETSNKRLKDQNFKNEGIVIKL